MSMLEDRATRLTGANAAAPMMAAMKVTKRNIWSTREGREKARR